MAITTVNYRDIDIEVIGDFYPSERGAYCIATGGTSDYPDSFAINQAKVNGVDILRLLDDEAIEYLTDQAVINLKS